MRHIIVTLLCFGATAACTRTEAASSLQAQSDGAAELVVRSLLDAAKAKNADVMSTRLCGDVDQARAKAALAGPLGITDYQVTRVEPAWVGAEPYFRVDVTLHKASGKDARSLAVRTRDGCVDRLWGEPVAPAQAPESGEISL